MPVCVANVRAHFKGAITKKVSQLETRVSDHDEILIELVRQIRKLIDTPKPKRKTRSIGFIESDKLKKKG